MAKFLTTSGTSYYIERTIIDAKKKLVLVSPYLQISKTFLERLNDASNKGVQIKIIYGKDELKPNEKNSLAKIDNIELFFFENLHAKCYLNESAMVITSMNMYEFSEKNNREMGVFITKKEDVELFQDAINEVGSIIQSSEEIILAKTERKLKRTNLQSISTIDSNEKETTEGYCIRCETRKTYNTDYPYCTDCFKVWVQYENPDFEENVCHCCGEFSNTTMNKPECYDCYKLHKNDIKTNRRSNFFNAKSWKN